MLDLMTSFTCSVNMFVYMLTHDNMNVFNKHRFNAIVHFFRGIIDSMMSHFLIITVMLYFVKTTQRLI